MCILQRTCVQAFLIHIQRHHKKDNMAWFGEDDRYSLFLSKNLFPILPEIATLLRPLQ